MNVTKLSQLTPGQLHLLKESLQFFAAIANGNSRAHGFYDEQDGVVESLRFLPKQEGQMHPQDKYFLDIRLSKIALIHSELGEMTEGVRKPGPDEHCPKFTSEEIEAADVFIRLMDYAQEWGLQFAEAVVAKMEYNASRPYKHGKGA